MILTYKIKNIVDKIAACGFNQVATYLSSIVEGEKK
jgi:hypothetical protein